MMRLLILKMTNGYVERKNELLTRSKFVQIRSNLHQPLHSRALLSILVLLIPSLFVPFVPTVPLPSNPWQGSSSLPQTSTISKAPSQPGQTGVPVFLVDGQVIGKAHAQSSLPRQGGNLDLGPTHLSATISSKEERPLEQLQPNSSKDLEVEYLNFSFEDDNTFEYELGKDQKFKKGSLRSNIRYRKEIEASEFILDVVKNGYKLPFQTFPAQKEFKNNKSSLIHSDFVTASIRDLLESNRIVELHSKPYAVSPLSVSANKEKKRLILDLRYVNQHLERQRVRFEDWKVFQTI